ncbi:MAG: 4a-hydroxytetrahydrobiopterin dehydratase [Bacteroidota bacterium]
MPSRDPLPPAAVDEALAPLGGWRQQAADGESLIERRFEFGDFREAFAFLTRVAFEAEALDHHPEIGNVYNQVTLRLSTHDAGNRVTETDLVMAQRIDALLSS